MEMSLPWGYEGHGEHGAPVLVALAASYGDDELFEVYVLDAEIDALSEAKA